VNIFFDTSSLISLYHQEKETNKILGFLADNPGYNIYLSELTLVESYSAILKKVRIQHLTLAEAKKFLRVLDNDFKRFSFIPLDLSVLTSSQQLLVRYGLKGLRSLDAIQLASVISVKANIDLALTGDITLKQILTEEGFNCEY